MSRASQLHHPYTTSCTHLVPTMRVDRDGERFVHLERAVFKEQPVHGGAARPAVQPDEQRLVLRVLFGFKEPVEELPLRRRVRRQQPRPLLGGECAGGQPGQLADQVLVRRPMLLWDARASS